MSREEPNERRRLLERPLLGEFRITDAALSGAERLLNTYRGADGDHEGIVFLLGAELERLTIFTGALAPEADHRPRSVFCSREQVLAASRAARAAGVSLLAQLHSHPGAAAYHSEGDDRMVLMPFEGMLSMVASHYGHFGLRPLHTLAVHQYQDGGWVLCIPQSVRDQFRVLPSELDLR
jgi:proteasome lid subunit RPN8/RPN11